MNRLKRMIPIMELAATREKQAAQDLGLSQRKLEEVRNGLGSLRSFRTQYATLFHQSGTRGIGIQQLAEYRAFLHKINVAIGEQEKVVQSCEADLEARTAAWQEAHRRALGLQKVLDRLHEDECRQERQREQTELDERAGRRDGLPKTLLTVFL